ncbi:MAG: TIM barrel protein [Betaproteobacteria bacterium]
MRKSIATVSMSGTLREKLEAIAAARFDGYELFESDLTYFKESPAVAGSIARDLGLSCELYQPFRDFEGSTDAAFRRSLERAERKFDVMQALGAPLMLVCSNTSPDVIPDEELAAAQLHELAERAARRNLRIGYEALAWGRAVNRYAQAWAIVERANHPQLGLILDSFHTFSLKDDPAGIANIPGEKIFFMQLADAPLLVMDVLQWARHFRSFPGQGQFDLESFLAHVLEAGYSGPISLEIFNDVFRERPNRRTAKDAMRSLLYLEGQVRSRFERATQEGDTAGKLAARVLECIELFDPPEPSPVTGIAFIEFAVDEVSGLELGTLLEHLGFRRAGRHRSRDLTLYMQGEMRFVLNADPLAFERAHFLEYGPSVCAIGLYTADPIRALNRATAMQSIRYEGRLAPDGPPLPAITAPDGSVIYFVDAALGRDGLFHAGFDLADDSMDPHLPPQLQYVDHIALGLPTDALDSWVLFCRAVLDMVPGDSLELSDPFGLIRSAGMASRDSSVRFVLNVSLSQRTHTARTIDALGGRSVQHIGIGCTDIVATVASLQAAGAEFVPISPNYYEDLLARQDLDPGLVGRMRDLGIVYDRSDEGEYLHVYGTSFAGRFFFEIVQRVGAYDGYGALNAPARMASQAQATTTHAARDD